MFSVLVFMNEMLNKHLRMKTGRRQIKSLQRLQLLVRLKCDLTEAAVKFSNTTSRAVAGAVPRYSEILAQK